MKVSSNKIADILRHYEELLYTHFSEHESAQLIRILIAHFTNIPKNEISLNLNKRVSESQILKIHFGTKELINDKPLQYILGTATFLDWEFEVNQDTLIPRPETEELVILIHKSLKGAGENHKILDIGTGSGCIAISLQKLTHAQVSAVDISKKALEKAKKNASKLEASINFIEADIRNKQQWENISGSFDLIVSNPPYVLHSEKELMQANVLDYEPELALFVENSDPLLFYQHITNFAKEQLSDQGVLWFEINENMGHEMQLLLSKYFKNVQLIKDFRDKDRFCVASGVIRQPPDSNQDLTL